MKIDDDIEMLECIHGDYRGCRTAVALENAISNLRKYQKIEQIIKDYDNDKMPEDYWYIDKIKEVIEDDKA